MSTARVLACLADPVRTRPGFLRMGTRHYWTNRTARNDEFGADVFDHDCANEHGDIVPDGRYTEDVAFVCLLDRRRKRESPI